MCANDSIVCKWHCQYEVDDNECEYITDCEWLVVKSSYLFYLKNIYIYIS